MIRNASKLAAVALTSLTFAACSGGSSPTATLPAPTASAPPLGQMRQGEGKIVLNFRESAQSNSARSRKYLSFAAASVSITTDGGAPQTINLSNCSASGDGTQAACPAIGFTAPVGAHTFVVTAYDGMNGTNDALGTATVTATVVANTTTPMYLSLFGVPAFGGLHLTTSTATAGAASQSQLTSTALDAKGYIILGQYANPITITKSNDPNNAVTLSKTTLTSSSDAIAVAYNGGTLSGPVVFTPSAPGDSAGPISLSPGAAKQPMLVTVNAFAGIDDAIDVYDPTVNGAQKPLFETTGTNGIHGYVAFAPDNGDIYYLSVSQLTVFQGYQATTSQKARLNLQSPPSAIAISSSVGGVNVVSAVADNSYDAAGDIANIIEFTTLNNNVANDAYQVVNQAPLTNEVFSSTAYNNFTTVAALGRGGVLLTGSGGISILTNGGKTVAGIISYGSTIKSVSDMAFDKNTGKLWVCDPVSKDIVGIPSGAATADGSQIVTGPYVSSCSNLRVDSTGAVYVKNSGGNNTTINVFPTTVSGVGIPTRTLTLSRSDGNFDLVNI